jgi:hypothetical protein
MKNKRWNSFSAYERFFCEAKLAYNHTKHPAASAFAKVSARQVPTSDCFSGSPSVALELFTLTTHIRFRSGMRPRQLCLAELNLKTFGNASHSLDNDAVKRHETRPDHFHPSAAGVLSPRNYPRDATVPAMSA